MGIADNIGKVIDAATNVILNFLDGIARNGPKIIDKGMWTVLQLLEVFAMLLTSTPTDSLKGRPRLLGLSTV